MKYLKLYEEIKVYHGSNSKFDKFDKNKMNKNIGQATYGWGFYFTDTQEIANIYANEHDTQYVYHITLHKGKNIDQYDYLHFEKYPTISQLNKIKIGLDKENIKIDLTKIKISWDVITQLHDHFYNSYSLKKRFNYGLNLAKKDTSLFLLRCGIDGLKYQAPTNELSHEYGFDGYNYVVFDSNNIHIDKID